MTQDNMAEVENHRCSCAVIRTAVFGREFPRLSNKTLHFSHSQYMNATDFPRDTPVVRSKDIRCRTSTNSTTRMRRWAHFGLLLLLDLLLTAHTAPIEPVRRRLRSILMSNRTSL